MVFVLLWPGQTQFSSTTHIHTLSLSLYIYSLTLGPTMKILCHWVDVRKYEHPSVSAFKGPTGDAQFVRRSGPLILTFRLFTWWAPAAAHMAMKMATASPFIFRTINIQYGCSPHSYLDFYFMSDEGHASFPLSLFSSSSLVSESCSRS